MSRGTFRRSGFRSSVQMCIDSGLRVPRLSIIRFIVKPDSTMSSTMMTVRPEISSFMPITSLTVPVEVVP